MGKRSLNPKPTYLNPDPARAGPDRSYLCAEAGEEVTYAAAPEGALWEVVNYLELSPEIDYAAPDYDPTLERPALIDELLQWGSEQKERRLALASKLEWEPYKHVEDLSTLTDMQEAERVACERCGFIFKMYHADSWWCEIGDMMRKLVLTGVMVFVARDSSVQIAVGCLVNFAVLLGNVGLRPMADAVVRSPAFRPPLGSRAELAGGWNAQGFGSYEGSIDSCG